MLWYPQIYTHNLWEVNILEEKSWEIAWKVIWAPHLVSLLANNLFLRVVFEKFVSLPPTLICKQVFCFVVHLSAYLLFLLLLVSNICSGKWFCWVAYRQPQTFFLQPQNSLLPVGFNVLCSSPFWTITPKALLCEIIRGLLQSAVNIFMERKRRELVARRNKRALKACWVKLFSRAFQAISAAELPGARLAYSRRMDGVKRALQLPGRGFQVFLLACHEN